MSVSDSSDYDLVGRFSKVFAERIKTLDRAAALERELWSIYEQLREQNPAGAAALAPLAPARKPQMPPPPAEAPTAADRAASGGAESISDQVLAVLNADPTRIWRAENLRQATVRDKVTIAGFHSVLSKMLKGAKIERVAHGKYRARL